MPHIVLIYHALSAIRQNTQSKYAHLFQEVILCLYGFSPIAFRVGLHPSAAILVAAEAWSLLATKWVLNKLKNQTEGGIRERIEGTLTTGLGADVSEYHAIYDYHDKQGEVLPSEEG
ncbi:hypothetical protein PYW08_007592 [Mythimna loreyi]|uniref:Uncharacterized protein n=1 Tax=Mythimna loreyi TaxID=667449 RepID=A0ACC2QCQ2_9NEOP|nr:hypothetical protein PYW08_007592 [Mythimna loreyi]